MRALEMRRREQRQLEPQNASQPTTADIQDSAESASVAEENPAGNASRPVPAASREPGNAEQESPTAAPEEAHSAEQADGAHDSTGAESQAGEDAADGHEADGTREANRTEEGSRPAATGGVAAPSGASVDDGDEDAGWELQPFPGTAAEHAVVWRRVKKRVLPAVAPLPQRALWGSSRRQEYAVGGTFRHFDGSLMRVLNVTSCDGCNASAGGAGSGVLLPQIGGGWRLQDAALLHPPRH